MTGPAHARIALAAKLKMKGEIAAAQVAAFLHAGAQGIVNKLLQDSLEQHVISAARRSAKVRFAVFEYLRDVSLRQWRKPEQAH